MFDEDKVLRQAKFFANKIDYEVYKLFRQYVSEVLRFRNHIENTDPWAFDETDDYEFLGVVGFGMPYELDVLIETDPLEIKRNAFLIINGVMIATKQLHNIGISHRNIAPHSISIGKHKDFAVLSGFEKIGQQYGSQQKGDEFWNAPETLLTAENQVEGVDVKMNEMPDTVDYFKADIYSIGKLLIHMLTQLHSANFTIDRLYNETELEHFEMIKKMIDVNPSQRPELEDLIKWSDTEAMWQRGKFFKREKGANPTYTRISQQYQNFDETLMYEIEMMDEIKMPSMKSVFTGTGKKLSNVIESKRWDPALWQNYQKQWYAPFNCEAFFVDRHLNEINSNQHRDLQTRLGKMSHEELNKYDLHDYVCYRFEIKDRIAGGTPIDKVLFAEIMDFIEYQVECTVKKVKGKIKLTRGDNSRNYNRKEIAANGNVIYTCTDATCKGKIEQRGEQFFEISDCKYHPGSNRNKFQEDQQRFKDGNAIGKNENEE